MYLLDTNVISETRLPVRGNRSALSWLDSVDESALHLSAITEFELEVGVVAKERSDPEQGARYRHWLIGVQAAFDARTLPVTREVARICARLNVPDRRPLADSLIAATALRHDLVLVTRNERDFDIPGLAVLNPFS